MYNPSFPSSNISQNANPSSFSDNSNYTISYNDTVNYDDDPEFGLSGFDYPMFGDNHTIIQELEPSASFTTQAPAVSMMSAQELADFSYGSSSSSHNIPQHRHTEHKINDMKRANIGDGQSVTFRTLSEFENLDDGYKWRKYGKKMLKTSKYPRNYYKCSSEGCKVKKRVEREEQDHRYVLTTYEGIHNHETPSVMHYDNLLLSGWTWQSSSQYSSL